jgi:hypothetical protein
VMPQHGSAPSSAHVPSCTEGAFAHTQPQAPLGVPMWRVGSYMSCPLILTIRHCAPSDVPEEGSGYESG